MNEPQAAIIAAIIGGGFAIVAALITILPNIFSDNENSPMRAGQIMSTAITLIGITMALVAALVPNLLSSGSSTPTPRPEITEQVAAITTTLVPENTDIIETTSPTLTATDQPPTTTPTPDGLQKAQIGVTNNAEWEPIMRDFDGVEMVLVPAGCFMMGSQAGDDDEVPVHEICFEQPFWIDRYEATNYQFGSVGCSEYSSEESQPRNCISWFEARDYCVGRDGRLPFEPEWEYAARGIDSLIYTWGNAFDGTKLNYCDASCTLPASDATFNDGYEKPAPVFDITSDVSWVGAIHMSGNLWEWTNSIYDQTRFDYPHQSDGREANTSDQADANRVIRGGSFAHDAFNARAADRDFQSPHNGEVQTGVRCVRDFEQP